MLHGGSFIVRPRKDAKGNIVRDKHGNMIVDLYTKKEAHGMEVIDWAFNEAMNEGDATSWGKRMPMKPTRLRDGRYIMAGSTGQLREVRFAEAKVIASPVLDQLTDMRKKLEDVGLSEPIRTDHGAFLNTFLRVKMDDQLTIMRSGDADTILGDLLNHPNCTRELMAAISDRIQAKMRENEGAIGPLPATPQGGQPRPDLEITPPTQVHSPAAPARALSPEELAFAQGTGQVHEAEERGPAAQGGGTGRGQDLPEGDPGLAGDDEPEPEAGTPPQSREEALT